MVTGRAYLFVGLAALTAGCRPGDQSVGNVTYGADSSDEGDDSGIDGDSEGSADGGGDAATGDAGGDEADDGGDGGEDDGGDPVRFDLSAVPDAPACGGAGYNPLSFLWAANSNQGTISKIDTQTLQEVGRFAVRPDQAGNPSRTSVSESGHVAVANRNGGLTKVWAISDFCAEKNGEPGIQTSTNGQFLPWEEEECVAWYTPMDYHTQRPVAWAPGEFNELTCQYENEKVWTSGRGFQHAATEVDVVRVNGDTGEIEDTVFIAGVAASGFGLYGGAVDGDGNFWATQLGLGSLVKVDAEDLTFGIWPMPVNGYGMTVDSDGYVWTCQQTVARFDPETETWMTAFTGGGGGGCMANDEYLYQGGGPIRAVNRQTLELEKVYEMPPGHGAKGVSIDMDGYIWGVGGPYANRVDPEDGTVEFLVGLDNAYTYSDMTGFALRNAGVAG